MLEFAEKTLLAGIGALSLTQKKGEELFEELKERLNLTEEEGKKLFSKMQDAAKENQQRLEDLAREEVQKTCDRLGVVTAEEYNKLEKRIEQLEKRLQAQTK